MADNYFAPAFNVKINGSGLKADVSKYITQISVVKGLDTMDQFSLTIANPYPDMRWTHKDDRHLFKEGNQIRIELGYVGDLQVMFDGNITAISPTFPESGTPTLSIQGYNRLYQLQSSKKTRTFQNMSDQQIVEGIATEAGLSPNVQETSTQHEFVMQCNKTDFAFLKIRANRIGFEFLVQDKELIFRKAEDDAAKTYALEWGKTLKSFSPKMNILNQVDEVIVGGYDRNTKESIIGRAGSGDEHTKSGKKTGPQIAKEAFGKSTKETVDNMPVETQEEADELASSIYNERILQFITGSCSSIGIPDLQAGHWIELKGLGPRFSGDYYITKTTHSIGGGGYQTTFDVERNAVNE